LIVGRTVDTLSKFWFFLEFTIGTIVLNSTANLAISLSIIIIGFALGLGTMIALGILSFRRLREAVMTNVVESKIFVEDLDQA